MLLPFLTRDMPGIGGTIKARPEDFFVQEIPLYEPSGQGEHVFCEIEKKGLTTFDAIDRIARALNVSFRDIGYAGLKDARAITRQVISIWGTTEDKAMALKLPGIKVNWAIRHVNKLRLGHLASNRFAIRIREVEPTAVLKIRPILAELQKRGMPNYFGEQRFGRRGTNDKLGAAVVSGDARRLLGELLGHPTEADDPKTARARAAFDKGELAEAMHLYPRNHGMERRILARLIKTHKPSAAARAVDYKLQRLWVSALQSRMFNDVVSHRIDALDKVFDGDLAWKHDSGAVFSVEQAAVEQPRCDAFEISPTGPLLGYRMTMPAGKPLEIEQACFAAAGLAAGDFRRAGQLKVKGARRPLRVRPEELQFEGGVDEHGSYVVIAFTLPAGSFATCLLREVTKVGDDGPGSENDDADDSSQSMHEAETGSDD